MTQMPSHYGQLPHVYSLTGYSVDGLFEEVFLVHEENCHPNEFQALVINAVGKLRQRKPSDCFSIHEVAKILERKFGFRRYSFYSCAVFDGDRNLICETSVRG